MKARIRQQWDSLPFTVKAGLLAIMVSLVVAVSAHAVSQLATRSTTAPQPTHHLGTNQTRPGRQSAASPLHVVAVGAPRRDVAQRLDRVTTRSATVSARYVRVHAGRAPGRTRGMVPGVPKLGRPTPAGLKVALTRTVRSARPGGIVHRDPKGGPPRVAR